MKKPTIKDVAKYSGVSPSTVSRVIVGSPKISHATKQRVREAMQKLDYHPNAVARSLASSTTKTLGLILPMAGKNLFANQFFIQAMKGISVRAQERGYYLMYTFSESEEQELIFIKDYIRSRLVDGIILLTARHKDLCIEYLTSINFPFAVIGHPVDTGDILWVDNDNFQAMYKVINYLIERGRKEISFIGGPFSFNVTQHRLAGYETALKNRGFPVNGALIQEGADFSEEAGYTCMQAILSIKKPDAVVTTDDELAFGVLKAMKKEFIENISVVGFNNSIRGMYQKPTLTTVDIHPEELGFYSTELVINKIENKESIDHYIVETTLIERETTRPEHR
ncbi:MAG: LacI family DNA-binding transcriptional regulator [Candidatus Omnitrophota bacterium]